MFIGKNGRLGKEDRLRKARADAGGYLLYPSVRKVITKSPRRILRKLYSTKMHTYIPCESSIEFDHVTTLDARRDVISIVAQPEVIYYVLDGKKRHTIPDFRVVLDDGTAELHECRTDEEAALEQIQREKEAITAECASRGVRYIEAKAGDVRREPRLSNARILRDQRNRHVSPALKWEVLRLLGDKGSNSLSEICDTHLPGLAKPEDIIALAILGPVCLDWEINPIGPASRVALPP